MITPEPPAGSEHYREGWRHGYEQAAIDRERSADAMTAEARVLVARCDNYREDVDAPCTGEIRFRWGMSQSDPCDTCGARCGIAVAAWERVELAGAVPDTGQAREPHRVLVYGENDRTEWQDCDGEDCETCGSQDTVQAPDMAELLRRLDEIDAGNQTFIPGGKLPAVIATAEVRALLGTDTTPEAPDA